MRNFELLIHVPHASTDIPDWAQEAFLIDQSEAREEATISADLFTDKLAQEAWPGATIVAAELSRIVVDVERYADDAAEEMSQVGRGMIYTHSHTGKRIKRDLSPDMREWVRQTWYVTHWERLRNAATGKVLVDLHTYPLAPWAVETNQDAMRPEIDIGHSDGLSPTSWIDALTTHFEGHGFSVGHNEPYVGVVDAGASAAVMIEIRRDVVGVPGASPQWSRLVEVLSEMPIHEADATI